jgi:WD40 repeat protein
MENNDINASLSTQNLTFITGGSPVSFDIIVNNDSDIFADFQIDIKAAGGNRNQWEKWYRLEPEVSSAKPPGSSTNFQVIIFDTPITGFVGTANLTVRIFSLQLRQERRLLLRLNIESDNKPNSLGLQLPVKQFHVDASNPIDIPVRVNNNGQQSTEVTLSFVVDERWLIRNSQQRFSLSGGSQKEVIFHCQAPSVNKAPSKNYPFKVEAVGSNSYSNSVEGNIEISPFGFIEFHIPNPQQIIPAQRQFLPNPKSDTASFVLHFKNISNLIQQINIQLQGKDASKCSFQQIPENADLDVGKTNQITLDIKTKRHWVGIRKKLQLEVKAELSEQRLGSTTEPSTKTLELKVLPVIPMWLQLTVLALIVGILSLPKPDQVMHKQSVNSVDLNGVGNIAVSVSNDCTLRRWEVRDRKLKPEILTIETNNKACGNSHDKKGLLSIFDIGAKVVRFIPKDNNIVAVGLDKGLIQLRDVNSGKLISELKDTTIQEPDQIFDLEFTPDSDFLFSGHGSGKVRFWSIESPSSQPVRSPKQILNLSDKLKRIFEIKALKFIRTPTNRGTLIIAGNYSTFILLPWNPDRLQKGFQEIFIQQKNDESNDIRALAALTSQNILATADSAGYITTWNLDECLKEISSDSTQKQPINQLNCAVLSQWKASQVAGVNSLAFSKNGQLLVSGGGDGRVMVWELDDEYKLDETEKGQKIYENSKAINSIDLETNSQGDLIVLIGSEDKQVKIHRVIIKSQ